MNRTEHLIQAAELIYQATEHIEEAGNSFVTGLLQRILEHLYVLIALLGD